VEGGRSGSNGYRNALAGNTTAQIFWLKNRRPDRWRDVQQLQGEVGHYLLSDRPLTEDEWIEQRTKLEPKDVTPAVPDNGRSTEKPGNNNDL
jgi:hypothetical protein